MAREKKRDYSCTQCRGKAKIALVPNMDNHGTETPSCNNMIFPGERICLHCGMKRGIPIFLNTPA